MSAHNPDRDVADAGCGILLLCLAGMGIFGAALYFVIWLIGQGVEWLIK